VRVQTHISKYGLILHSIVILSGAKDLDVCLKMRKVGYASIAIFIFWPLHIYGQTVRPFATLRMTGL